jgi:hypothetical protein
MEWIILLPTLIIVESAIEACFVMVARRKGRAAPWSLSFEFGPPEFADSQLNRIEHLLLIVVAPLGVGAALVGMLWAFADVESNVSTELLLGAFVLICLRGILLAACLAFAELDTTVTAPASHG